MKTTRLESWLKRKLSEDGPMNTGQLRDAYNSHDRHGTSMGAISNVLAKRKAFIKVGHDFKIGTDGSRIRNDVWALAVEE